MRGALLIDKPPGLTSFQVISKIRKLLKVKSVGHTGSLDLIASGLLVVLLEQATKLVPYLSNVEKEYIVEAVLGYETLSGDEQGEILYEKKTDNITEEKIKEVLKRFRAKVYQRPPIFSSLKLKGRRYNEMAREGILVPPPMRKVYIREIELLNYRENIVSMRMIVGPGVYIRSIVRDMGRLLGTGATVKGLRRVRIDRFKVESAYKLEEIQNVDELKILTVKELLSHLSRMVLTDKGVYKAITGQNLFPSDFIEVRNFNSLSNLIILTDPDDKLLMLGRNRGNFIHPERMIYNDSGQ